MKMNSLFEEEPIFKDNPHLSVTWPNIEVKYETKEITILEKQLPKRMTNEQLKIVLDSVHPKLRLEKINYVANDTVRLLFSWEGCGEVEYEIQL